MTIPILAFGNDTLEKLQPVKPGDVFMCHRCSQQHELEGPDDDPTNPVILFYKCGGASYLGGVGGRLTVNVPSDINDSKEES